MIMKGMTLDQCKEVMELAQELHSFANYYDNEARNEIRKKYPNYPDYGYSIKYIDTTYDSRTKDVWSITFRQGSLGIRFSSNHFAALFDKIPKQWKYNNLYDLCMDYLKGDFNPKEEFFVDLNKGQTQTL